MYDFNDLFDNDFSFNKYSIGLSNKAIKSSKYAVLYQDNDMWIFYKGYDDKISAVKNAAIIDNFGYDVKIIDIQNYIKNTTEISFNDLINNPNYHNAIIDIIEDFADGSIDSKKGFITPDGNVIKVNNIHSSTDQKIIYEIEKELNVYIEDYNYYDMLLDYFCVRVNGAEEMYISVNKNMTLTQRQSYALSDWIDNLFINNTSAKLQVNCIDGNTIDYVTYDLLECDGTYIVNKIKRCLNGGKLTESSNI